MSVKIRQVCFWIHRYSGLTMALFLFIAGITGALLAFHEELDDWFNHKLVYVEIENRPQLPISTLHDKVVKTYPKYKFSSMPVTLQPNKSVVFEVDRVRKQQPDDKNIAPFQEVYVNPYSAEIIGSRDKEVWAWNNTMWKVFWLHRELLLGQTGKLILGVVALVWTLNCFIGFYLTLPRIIKTKKGNNGNKSSVKRASLLKRWLPAWKIRRKTNFFKLNYDVHQAFGLWLWVILFVIAWSSVGFNLNSVYQPVMQTVVGLQPFEKVDKNQSKPGQDNQPTINSSRESNSETTPIKITKAQSIDYLLAQADKVSADQGLKVEQALGLRWIEEDKQWQMRFKTNKDIGTKVGASSVTIDAITGKVERTHFGHQSLTSNKINEWLMSLHMGHIGIGLVHTLYQVFLSIIGMAVSTLSFTGVYLWWRGRKVRQRNALRSIQDTNKRPL